MIDEKPGRVQVLFDLRQAKSIPAHAPMIAIRSGMLTKANTGRVAVVTTDMVAEILAGVAARITHHDIRFFSLCQTALAYLEADTAQPSLR